MSLTTIVSNYSTTQWCESKISPMVRHLTVRFCEERLISRLLVQYSTVCLVNLNINNNQNKYDQHGLGERESERLM